MKNHGERNGADLYTKEIRAIAVIEGCFPQKFGVPRQSGIAKNARGIIRFLPPFNHENFIQGLELSSHIWLTFGFHHNRWNGKATVRPQRLGGNERMGVFATRSSFRPNGLGLSAVKLESIDFEKCQLEVSGHDLVDGTPIYDIKPYIPFADSLPEAVSDFAKEAPTAYPVYFSEAVMPVLQIMMTQHPHIQTLITEVIGQNPTPQFHDDAERVYGVALGEWDILFQKRLIDDESQIVVMQEYREKFKIDSAYYSPENVNKCKKDMTEVNKQKLIGFTVTEIKVRSAEIGDT